MDELIAFRFFRGLGGGGLMIVALAIISGLVGPREVGRYMGLMGGVIGIAAVAGPLTGGLDRGPLLLALDLYINIPIGLVTQLVVSNATLPGSASTRPTRADPPARGSVPRPCRRGPRLVSYRYGPRRP